MKLDGEREYKAALAEIKSGLNVLKSELNLASEQFRDNADSVEALTKKNDILDRTILKQKEKIEQIEKALQSAAETYGEADERTNRWKTQLNNAQAELVKMERALKDNEDALQKAQREADGTTTAFGKLKKALSDTKEQGGGIKGLFANLKEEFSGNDEVMRGLGDALTDVAGKFGIQLPDAAKKAVASLNGIHAGTALAYTGLGLLGAALVKAEKALISMTKKGAEYAKEIKTFSSVTGQSVESLQEFDYAAEMIGVSSDRIRDSLKETTNKMQEARDGNEATAAAYAKLGVSITDADGNLRSAEDVFYDTIDALGQMENRTERDALAMDLMSESAQELNPLIDAGSGALKKYADEAHDMGYVLDNEALTALTEVDDAYQRLQKSQESAKNQLSAEFAPYLTEFYEKITKLIKDGGQAMKESGLVDSFGMLLETVGNIIAPTDDLANGAVPNLTKALRPLSEVVATIADTLQVISGLVTLATTPLWHFDKWASGFTKIGTGLGMNKNQPSNLQRLWAQWEGADTNAATNAAGYGAYYANGKYYGNRDAYLREQWESELNAGGVVGSFEAWKQAMGYTRNASGTDWFPGGRTLLSEHGAETAILPQGTRILTAQETRQTGGDTYNITIDAHTVREFEDILRIVQDRRRVVRMGGT
jgi:methyl-accepting chemotaxis protein